MRQQLLAKICMIELLLNYYIEISYQLHTINIKICGYTLLQNICQAEILLNYLQKQIRRRPTGSLRKTSYFSPNQPSIQSLLPLQSWLVLDKLEELDQNLMTRLLQQITLYISPLYYHFYKMYSFFPLYLILLLQHYYQNGYFLLEYPKIRVYYGL